MVSKYFVTAFYYHLHLDLDDYRYDEIQTVNTQNALFKKKAAKASGASEN